jgi:glycopeptide antibiotics resistance protein
MAALGISAMNEIMEFLIAVTVERNGVGGYENAMIDLIFNVSGATIAVVGYLVLRRFSSK